jgi:tricorn protease
MMHPSALVPALVLTVSLFAAQGASAWAGALPPAAGVGADSASTPAHASASEVRGYYRSPALHGGTLVFASEGDLWSVPVEGGTARRLTSHPTEETDPHISPDGRWLAFTGRYAGSADVYLMPLEGGPVRRLTWESGAAQVQGWTPEGEVLYATNGSVGPTWTWHLKVVDPETLERRDIPLADARQGAFDGNGRLYFTRFGMDVTGDNVREYRGGAMAELWRFDLNGTGDGHEAERLAREHEGNLTRPMWWDGSLYVVSDADGAFNLWRLEPGVEGTTPDEGTGSGANTAPLGAATAVDARQLTTHTDFEVRGATLSDGRIVYQHGADIRLYDIATGRDQPIDIRLASDRSRTRERWLDAPMDYLGSISLAPTGDRVAVTARGRLAVAHTGSVRRVEIGLPEAARARGAVMGPEGEWVYAFVDADEEKEIWRFPADGRGQGERLTDDGDTQRTGMHVSPDGRWIAHTDRERRLWLLDLETGTNAVIDESRSGGHGGITWSPDSRALAFSRTDTGMRRPQIVVYDIEGGAAHVLTSDRYESRSPAFSADGRWLFFLSDRTFNATPGSPWGDRNLGPMFDRRTRIYALALQPGNAFPLEPRTELTAENAGGRGGNAAGSRGGGGNAAGTGETPGRSGEAAGAGRDDPPAIDFAGLAGRLYEVPVPAGNYSGLVAAEGRLFLLDRSGGGQPTLRTIAFSRDRARLETVAEGVSSVQLSGDRSRMLVRRGSDWLIVPTAAQIPGDVSEARVRLDNWRLPIDPAEEWRQMFVDAWRMQRDFLFDPDLRGQDWDAIRDKYAPLVERIGDRRELDDIFRQMVAELGVLHSQIRSGDVPSDSESAQPSFLGGELEPGGGGMRITRIYRTDPELPGDRAPLARPGVDLRVGDVVTAVNGRTVAGVDALARALAHQAGEQVRLDYLRDGEEGSVVTRPVSAGRNTQLRYSDWVTGRREVVEAASDGRIGYLHIRAMGSGDIAEFAREFYANIDREGLVIDVRRNTGGNIDSWIIEKLLRRAWSFWEPPGQEPYWNMQQSFRGHLVVLADPLTYSDGETFSAGVKALELGPLIGERTAGAGVWLSDTNRLADQGLMRAAQTPQFGQDGRWLIEGFGVEPDIEVVNLPHATWRGEDAQLERGIAELLRVIDENPVRQPPAERIPPRGVVGGEPG